MANVYRMNEYEWWASNLSIEETLAFYLKQTGCTEDETDPVDEITICDLDSDGQYIPFEDEAQIAEYEAQCIEEVIVPVEGNEKKRGFGSIIKRGGEWYIRVPFRKALEYANFTEKDEPFCTASTEW